ncbi:MAG: ABC transporter permease subunit [Roseiflexaceae bacterium]
MRSLTNNARRLMHPLAVLAHALGQAALWLALLLPLLVFPLSAFSQRWFYPQLLPREWTIAPLLDQLGRVDVRDALGATLQIALWASAIALLVSYPAARTLGMCDFRGKRLVLMALFLPTVVPPVAMGMGLNILFLRLGVAGTLVGVILVHLIPVLPYTVFALVGVFARYDPNYEYQALVLGASRARIFFSVTLPLVLPGLLVAGLFAFLISWSQYLLTFLIGGGQVLTLPLLLFAAVAGGNPTTIAILSLIFAAPPIVVIAATARYLTSAEGLERRGQY